MLAVLSPIFWFIGMPVCMHFADRMKYPHNTDMVWAYYVLGALTFPAMVIVGVACSFGIESPWVAGPVCVGSNVAILAFVIWGLYEHFKTKKGGY